MAHPARIACPARTAKGVLVLTGGGRMVRPLSWRGSYGLSIPKDSVAGRAELENYLEVRRAQEDGGEFKQIRRGWCLGSEQFRQELLEQARAVAGAERISKLEIEAEQQHDFNLK